MIMAPILGATFGVALDLTGLRDQVEPLAAELDKRFGGAWEMTVDAGGARGGAKNRIIAAAQANRRRDPFYLNAAAVEDIRDLALGLFEGPVSVQVAAAKQIVQRMLVSVYENVQRQSNEDGGRFRDLTEAYKRRKQKDHGFIYPILRASADLLTGLVTNYRKV